MWIGSCIIWLLGFCILHHELNPPPPYKCQMLTPPRICLLEIKTLYKRVYMKTLYKRVCIKTLYKTPCICLLNPMEFFVREKTPFHFCTIGAICNKADLVVVDINHHCIVPLVGEFLKRQSHNLSQTGHYRKTASKNYKNIIKTNTIKENAKLKTMQN